MQENASISDRHALGAMMKSSVDHFLQEYPLLDSSVEPHASIYDNVEALIRLGHDLNLQKQLFNR